LPVATVLAGDMAHLEILFGAVEVATFAPRVVRSDGTPLGGATLTFLASSLPDAGSVSIDAGAPVALGPAARVTVIADDAGGGAPVTLRRGASGAGAAPPAGAAGQGPATAPIDLSGGPPASPPTFAAAAAVATSLRVEAAGTMAAVEGARVVAIARGLRGV